MSIEQKIQELLGSIDPPDSTFGDIDTFVFDASAGESMHIRVVKPSGGLDPAVWLYNTRRPHRSLELCTPEEIHGKAA